MNKGIIVVLVLLLLAGAVIAGIVLTRKSKYTKDTNVPGGAALVPSNCGTNCAALACSNSECCTTDGICTGGTRDPPEGSKLLTPCDSDEDCDVKDGQVCIPGDDGQNRCYFAPIKKGGPPGKGCICWGRGKCEQNNEWCDCDPNSGLDGRLGCQVCNGAATWDPEAQKCVDPNPCQHFGTPGTDGKSCECLGGWDTNNDCKCGTAAPTLTCPTSPPRRSCCGNINVRGWNGNSGCAALAVCPWGAGMKLELDPTYANGGCVGQYYGTKPDHPLWPPAASAPSDSGGCWVVPADDAEGGLNCKFISSFDPALIGENGPSVPMEKVTVTQGGCNHLKAGHVTASSELLDTKFTESNVRTCEGSYLHDYSGQVRVPPPAC